MKMNLNDAVLLGLPADSPISQASLLNQLMDD